MTRTLRHAVLDREDTRRRPAAAVSVLRVDPRVWLAALSLAGGNARRLQVLSETEVLVHNVPGSYRPKGKS